ncbi:hypothetical protein ACWD11_03650 [Streptomyces sp. NPDC002776]
MGRSTKPRRRRAAAPALRYERQPRRPSSSGKAKKTGDVVFGCLIFLAVTGAAVVLVALDMFWAEDAWQWAADAWLGGAYSFAAFLGVIGPCLAALSFYCLCATQWKSWRLHPWRTLINTGAGIAAAAALAPCTALVYSAHDDGDRAKGNDGPPSWVFSSYPWLWAVGLLSTLVVITLAIWIAVAYYNRRRSTAALKTPGTLDDGERAPSAAL